MEPHGLTAHELKQMLQQGLISSKELTKSVFARISAVEEDVKAYITLTYDLAMDMADEADRRIKQKDRVTQLTGIPIAIKDVICIRGILTTCASRILSNFEPPYDATVIKRLKEAGAVFIGKTNLDEFAMGSSTENSAIKITLNPWDLERIPGGSSGGSAAAVAADETILSLGSDTGGSIRQPCALCGTVGIKPTYGRVSRYGLVAYASSLDQIGPITKDVEDTALLMNFLAGHDTQDSTSANVEVPNYTDFLYKSIKGIKLGVPKEYFVEGMDKEVESSIRSAIDQLSNLGAEIIEVSLPHTPYAIAAYYLCATAEASSNLARFDGAHYGYRAKGHENIIDMFSRTRAEGFGNEVKRRIMLGTYALSAGYYDAYYLKALRVRTLIKQDFEKAFESVDALVTPTSPTAAFKVGEKTEDPLQMYLSDIFTISVNLAGVPAISIPCGFTSNNLPIGLQLIAPNFQEGRLISIAHAYEQSTDHHTKRPVLGKACETE